MNRRSLILVFLGLLLLLEFGVLVWQFGSEGGSSVSLDPNAPGERLTQIAVEIHLKKDNSLLVKELIEFRSEQEKIEKGLYRSLPLSIASQDGKESKRSYVLKGVRYDGQEIKIESKEQGKFFFLELRPENEEAITQGKHAFEIEYTVQTAVEHFPEYDQFHYYLTGSWSLPVVRASAVVYLPKYLQSKSLIVKGFTGREDNKKLNFLTDSPKENVIRLWTSQPLLDGDEFRFELRIPRGFID